MSWGEAGRCLKANHRERGGIHRQGEEGQVDCAPESGVLRGGNHAADHG